MAHGTPKGSVDPKFSARIDELEQYAKKCVEQYREWQEVRPWSTPSELADRDLLDVPSLHEPPWNRNNINKIYSAQVLAGPADKGGTVGDLIAMKWQADFMATEERAFRLRHASQVRCAAIMHGRLDGHSVPEYGIFSYLRESVKAYLKAGEAHGAEDGRDGGGSTLA